MPLSAHGTALACILAYSWSFLVFGMQVNLLGPSLSVVAERVGRPEADLGVIFTINGLASIVGAIPSGYLTDRLPGHAVLAATMAIEALGFALIPLAGSMAALAGTYAATALSWNVLNTAGNTYVLWIGNAPGSRFDQTVLINVVNALFGLGSLAAPMAAELCARLQRPMAAYWLTSALTALSAVSFLLLPSPSRPGSSSSSSSSSDGGSGGQQQPGSADGAATQPLLAGEADEQQQQQQADAAAGSSSSHGGLGASGVCDGATSRAFCGWTRRAVALLAVVALFNLLNVGTEVAFGGWVFTYAVRQAGLSSHDGHYLNAAYWGSFTLGRVLASFAAALLAPQALLLASLPLALAGAVAALAVPASLADPAWLLLAATVLIGLGVSAGFANALALLDSFVPVQGSITGLLGGVAGAGCMTVPLAIALLAKASGNYQGLMWLSAASFAAQLACVAAMLALGRGMQREALQRGARSGGSVTGKLALHEEQQQAAV